MHSDFQGQPQLASKHNNTESGEAVMPKMLALVAKTLKRRDVAVIPLNDAFTFTVSQAGASGRKIWSITVEPSTAPTPRQSALPVNSLTVVYGENGEGKTSLLLDICRTFHAESKTRLGVVWRDDDGRIFLDPGTQLDNVRLEGTTVAERPKAPFEAGFGTVFYTTSPFEPTRHQALLAFGTIDVTPAFEDHSFVGTSLCAAVGALPRDIEFIRETRVAVKVDPIDLNEVIRAFAGLFEQDEVLDLSNGRRPRDPTPQLLKLTAKLTPRASQLLAIELRRAMLDGWKSAMNLYEGLFRRRPLLRDSRELTSFLTNYSKESDLTAAQILAAAQKLLKATTGKSGRGARISTCSRRIKEFSGRELEALRRAEQLGVLRWRFRELSSGQIALLMLFASLGSAFDALKRQGQPSAIVVIDEGEMFMHPAWQQKYLEDLMNFIKHYRKSFDELHVVLATHSLIVAGDAPPRRLLDAKTGKMENGFALGPLDLLTGVYRVDRFSGNLTTKDLEKIASFLRGDDLSPALEAEADALIDVVASKRLSMYLKDEVKRRKERGARREQQQDQDQEQNDA